MFGSEQMIIVVGSKKRFCKEFWSDKISGLTFFGYQINVWSHENWSPKKICS